MTESAFLNIRGLSFADRDRTLLDGYSIQIPAGALLACVSPDIRTCEVLANLIAGFERPKRGTIEIDGRDLSMRGPGRRGVMTIKPDLALFPDMSVFSNIAFPLEQQKHGTSEIHRRVEKVAKDTGLETSDLTRRPAEVTPESRVRAALARAFAAEPHLLVLERSLQSLTISARLAFLPEMRRVLRLFRTTALMATNDLHEAMALGDRLSVIMGGHEIQCGTPEAIFGQPANAVVARLAGACNLLSVTVSNADGRIEIHGPMLQNGHAILPRDRHPLGIEVGAALLAVRPEAVRLFLGIRRFDVLAEGIIADVMPHGNGARIRVTLDRHPHGVLADVPLPAPMPLEVGRRATVGWNRGDMHLLPPEETT